MGMLVTTSFAFGVDLGDDIPDIFYLTVDYDQEWESHDGDIHNFFAAWKKSKGENFDFPFDLVHYYSSENPHYVLAYKISIQRGYSDEPTWIQFPQIYAAHIKKMLVENGFIEESIEPAWCMVSVYG